MPALENLKRLFAYCYRILKESRNASDLLFDIRGDGKNFVDLSLFFDAEPLVTHENLAVQIRSQLVQTRTAELREKGRATETEVPQAHARLLHIYDQMLNNPYELDLVYAYQFVIGTDAHGGSVVAPIYLVPVSLQYDDRKGALSVECLSDEARVNLYALGALVPESEQLIVDGLNTSPYLHLPAALDEINVHFKRLSELQSKIEAPPLKNTSLQDPFEPWKSDKFVIRRTGALALVRKSNVYVVRDLEQLQKLPEERLGRSILARFAVEEASAAKPTVEQELILPFPSSEAQRSLARLALSHRMVLVQGPPGTGKSHTISNLVCHLVAQGNSVLVTSQKNKALEVVDQKLGTLKLDNLHLTLLKDDKESKKTVKRIVDDVLTRFSGVDPSRFARAAEAAVGELGAERQTLERLTREFAASRRFETLPVQGMACGEVFASYAKLRSFDLISAQDEVAWEMQASIQSAIEQGLQVHLSLGRDLGEAIRFAETEQPVDEPASLSEIEKRLQEETAVGPRAQIEELLKRHAEIKLDNAAGLSKAEDELRQLSDEIRKLYENSTRLFGPGIDLYQSLLKAFGDSLTQQAERDLAKLKTLGDELKTIEQFEDQSKALSADSLDKEALRGLLLTYRSKKHSLLRVFSSRYKEARQKLLSVCGATTPELTEQHELAVEARLRAQDGAERLSRCAREELGHLRLPDRKAFCPAVEASTFRAALEDRKKIVEFLSELQFLENRLRVLGLPNVQLDRVPDPVYFKDVNALLLKIAEMIHAYRCRLESDALLERFRRRGPSFRALVTAWEKQDVAGWKAARQSLEKLLERHRTYLRLVEVEAKTPGLTKTFRALRQDTLSGGMAAGTMHTDLERIVRAAALRTLTRKLEATAPRSTAQVATDVRMTEDHILVLMGKVAGAKLAARRGESLAMKAVNNTVSYFAKTLQRSSKDYKSFEELKTQTDFAALLKVLPCWICGIADVSRIFPLVDGLFDYVIVDEASQCFLPSSIPLLYRARQAIVVGDDQQLPNAEAGYVSKDLSKALMTELKMDRLPRAGSFDATENSLYDLACSFTDARVFLDEHFRCNPEIIQFSNARFYQNRLKIATESMSRSLGKSLEIVRVDGAKDDPETRVNRREAEQVVDFVVSKLSDARYAGQTLGVCSFFREQADAIADLISKRISVSDRLARQIVSTTADGFQGDERDAILFSFRFAPNSSPQIFAFLQTQDGQKRANVAFSRARKQVVCFLSAPVEQFPDGIARDYLQYVQDPKTLAVDTRPWESEFEASVGEAIERLGLQVLPRYATCGFRIDLVVWDGKYKPLAVECDGWRYFPDEDGQVREEQVARQSVLERTGWRVIRVSSRDYYRDRSLALSPIEEYFRQAVTPAK